MAIGVVVVARETRNHAIEHRRLTAVLQNAVVQRIDSVKVTGLAVTGTGTFPAPGELLLQTSGPGFLVVAHAHGRFAQGGVFEFSDGTGGEAHADGHTPIRGNGECGGRHFAHGATQIDATSFQGHQARFRIDLQIGAADDVAVLQ